MGFRGLLFVASALFAAPCAGAQDAGSAYPTRHIRLIAPFSAGSTLDIMSRLVAEKLAAGLGHNVVVDNRPGANGIVGIDLVAKAPPDGHTMLITTGSDRKSVV